MRPPLRFGSSSRSIGMSTRVYCGMVGESCVTMVIATGGPAGSSCASAKLVDASSAMAVGRMRFICFPFFDEVDAAFIPAGPETSR